jgi:hypothetical protein
LRFRVRLDGNLQSNIYEMFKEGRAVVRSSSPRSNFIKSRVRLFRTWCRQEATEVATTKRQGQLFIFVFGFALHADTIDQVEQEQCHQRESQDSEVRIEIPKIGHDHITEGRNLGDYREDLLVGETIDHSTNQETEQTRDKII